MMTDEQYREWAIDEHARLEVLRHEGEIANLIGQRKHATERQEIHQRLCARHKLNPAAASLRQVADCEIAHHHAWRDFVSNAHPAHRGGYPASEILSPESVVDSETRRAQVQALQAQLRKKFDAVPWPPADLVERLSATDGVTQHYGHSIGAAP